MCFPRRKLTSSPARCVCRPLPEVSAYGVIRWHLIKEYFWHIATPVQGLLAAPQDAVSRYLREGLGIRSNQTRHLVIQLKWEKSSVKWGGKDYGRSIWAKSGYTARQR